MLLNFLLFLMFLSEERKGNSMRKKEGDEREGKLERGEPKGQEREKKNKK